jgi:hypothetical protein
MNLADSGDFSFLNNIRDCMYSDEISYVNLQKSKQNFSVLSFNIQSLPAKFNEFQEFINSLQVKNVHPKVICLQEIWKLANSDMYTLKGYHPLVFKTRANNVQGGGVGLYVSSELNFSVLAVQSIFIDRIFESIMVEIEFSRNQKIVVGSLYRPGNHPVLTPKDQFTQFCDLLTNLFDNMNSSSKKFFIFGDTNIDVLKYGSNTEATDFIDLIFSHGVVQTVNKPTRVTNVSATLIDHVLTNTVDLSSLSTTILINKISDHFPIIQVIGQSKTDSAPKFLESRDFSETNIIRFREALSGLDWSHVTNETNTQISYNNFSDTFLSLYDVYFPLTRKKFNKNYHKIEPWITGGLLVSRRNKILLAKNCHLFPSVEGTNSYKRYLNMYNLLLRESKKMYFAAELKKNQSNIKKSWELINKAINKQKCKSSSVMNISVNGVSLLIRLQLQTSLTIFLLMWPVQSSMILTLRIKFLQKQIHLILQKMLRYLA